MSTVGTGMLSGVTAPSALIEKAEIVPEPWSAV